jgi:cytochrome d ubiquinol oxidase subunit I
LSFLSYNTPNGMVEGINDLQAQYEQQYGPGNYVPPAIWLTYWSFRAMVGSGVLMFLLGLVGLFFAFRSRLGDGQGKWLLRLLIPAILLPYLANSTGWMLTEVGRQPWIVQGLMTIDQAVSPNVTVGMLLISLIGFTLIYGLLMVADIYLLQKYARQDISGSGSLIPWFGPEEPPTAENKPRYERAY